MDLSELDVNYILIRVLSVSSRVFVLQTTVPGPGPQARVQHGGPGRNQRHGALQTGKPPHTASCDIHSPALGESGGEVRVNYGNPCQHFPFWSVLVYEAKKSKSSVY